MNHCINCGVELEGCDHDPNGEQNPICARCVAEEDHDFDVEPNATFNRTGERVDVPTIFVKVFPPKIGPWQMTADGCGAFRSWLGADPESIRDRVAFIEKTPRIRVRDASRDNDDHTDYLNWASRQFKGDGPNDQESRDWCDAALKLFYPEYF